MRNEGVMAKNVGSTHISEQGACWNSCAMPVKTIRTFLFPLSLTNTKKFIIESQSSDGRLIINHYYKFEILVLHENLVSQMYKIAVLGKSGSTKP